ncbi:MAG: complex I NDUFA9 subunit family protein [Granulosicoccus sp.]|nr:complex I NDUFA9 subunit family protein [Granulosicoccus sp.]
MSNSRVTLLGGSGFVGTQLTYRLANIFDEVVVLTRRAQRVRKLGTLVNVKVIETDIHDPDALNKAVLNSTAVINLVGILNEASRQRQSSFTGAHVDLTQSVIDACQAGGVARYLHVSALNADADKGSSEYLRTKGLAENIVRSCDSSINWTIFQPSIIFGEQDAFFNRFASLLRALPVFPLAVPEAKMAPVFVGDVCNVIIQSIDDPSAYGHTYQLCGPEDYTLRELVEYTAKTAGLSRKVIGLPDFAARLQARIMEFVPGKPFTRDNYLSLQTPSICQEGCQRQSTSLDAVVPRYLGSADWAGRLQKRRTAARR